MIIISIQGKGANDMVQKILLVSNHSENAYRATVAAGELALKFDAEILYIYVILPVPAIIQLAEEAGDTLYGVGSIAGLRGLDQAGEDILSQTTKILDRMGVRYSARLERGHPAVRICEVAHEEKADLIVIGRQGVRRATALSVASVCERVSQCATCSVLVVP
jgi:nucleotide-binding universal stress UspA family protein